MIIDFHTHIFPESIASKTIEHLENVGHITAYTDGTLQGLKDSMKVSQITTSVILPVVTKPSQFDSVNKYAASITGKDGIISFGGIHPDTMDYRKELVIIKSLSLKGIKLHPDYQNTFIDDEKYLNIIEYAVNQGLVISIHAGLDIGLPDPIHCTPLLANKMLDIVLSRTVNKEPVIILAHTGGYDQWDAVEEYLVGKNVFFDLSYSLGIISKEQVTRIIRNHGSEKILFASDSPWGSQQETLTQFYSLDLTKEEQDNILYRNACRILG